MAIHVTISPTMADEWGIAAVGAVAAVIGGLVSGAYNYFLERYNRPKLQIDFLGDSDNKVETEHLVNGKPESLIYVRAKVQNGGHHIAKSCRVFLTALHEVRSDGTVQTVIKDSKALAWAGWHFAPIDIPAGVNFYVDLMTVSKAESGWRFSVERLFDSQKKLLDYRGTYRFSLMVSGDNAAPARCEVNVEYNGDWHGLRAWQVPQKQVPQK
jgi:hypothetical protein